MKFLKKKGDDVLIISRLNRILDALPPTVSLNTAVHLRPNTPIEGLFFLYLNIMIKYYLRCDN